MTEEKDMPVVLVGSKEVLNYIYAIIRNEQCVVKARGMNIKRAIDASLIAQREYGFNITEVELYDETMKTEEGQERHLSAINITLSK